MVNSYSLEPQKTLSCKTLLMVLAIVSVAGNAFYMLSRFIEVIDSLLLALDCGDNFYAWYDVISSLFLFLSPLVLVLVSVYLLVYVLTLHQRPNANKLETVAFGGMALYYVVGSLSGLLSVFLVVLSNLEMFEDEYGMVFQASVLIGVVIGLLLNLACLIFFVLAAVETWKGSKRIFGIVAPIAWVLSVVTTAVSMIFGLLMALLEGYSIGYIFSEYIFSSTWFFVLGGIALFATFLVLVLRDKIAAKLKKS